MFAPFEDHAAEPAIRGFLHTPAAPSGQGVVLTHGAGGNCKAKLLVAVADALAAEGFAVLRFDLPFRLARPFGPPHPGTAERDRAGIRRAAELFKRRDGLLRPSATPTPARVFLAGHSYGGRQSSMLLAEAPDAADGLLLLSYPLHPPNKPAQLRTAHFPQLRKPAFFVHGARDPFATPEELHAALEQIPARHAVLEVTNAAHDLLTKKSPGDLPQRIAQQFHVFVGTAF